MEIMQIDEAHLLLLMKDLSEPGKTAKLEYSRLSYWNDRQWYDVYLTRGQVKALTAKLFVLKDRYHGPHAQKIEES